MLPSRPLSASTSARNAPTTELGGTDFVTTAFAPMIEFEPILIGTKTAAPAPIETLPPIATVIIPLAVIASYRDVLAYITVLPQNYPIRYDDSTTMRNNNTETNISQRANPTVTQVSHQPFDKNSH